MSDEALTKGVERDCVAVVGAEAGLLWRVAVLCGTSGWLERRVVWVRFLSMRREQSTETKYNTVSNSNTV